MRILVSLLFFIIGVLLIYNSLEYKTVDTNKISVTYYVGDCQPYTLTKSNIPAIIHFDNNTLIIKHSVDYVCCAKIVPKVEVKDDIVNITEINEGDVCKCMCRYIVEVNISGLEKKNYRIEVFGVKYKDIHEAKKLLDMNISLGSMESIKIDNFCGMSTYGKCTKDKDCIRGGCSGQVCQSIFEQKVITTCDWKACYNADFYGYECGCVDGKCQWHKK